YSDYIRYPIRMVTPVQKVKEGSSEDKPEFELVEEMTTVNSMVPLWQRKRSEVSDEEYQKFYQDLVRDFDKPARIITASVEGAVTYKALLFVPGKRPLNFNTEDFEKGLQLYSAGVMIMDKCDALLPDYLRFVRGVVDSPDLSLNISRELLQHDRQLKVIAGNLEKKIRGDLEKFLKEDREGYEKFYANYGRQIGYGIVGEGGETRKDALQELLMFYSSTEKKLVTLREYVDRMRSEQKCIYYAAGESIAAIDLLPQTELLKDKNYEILYFTGEADEFVVQTLQMYADKPFRSIVDGDLELGDEEEKVDDEKPEVMKFIKEVLGDKIKEARVSRRLKTHPVCMTAGEGFSFEMEKYFKNFQMPTPVKAERILELNVKHPAYVALETAMVTDRAKAERYVKILYNQALLIAGLPLEDPSEYTDMVAELMK
ncbi:MAG: molecular chaperone HtpG, partial [Oscillospiraceae bacterium]|nr:molecular chaperone HtpG [Oscillospiraceae bacterium]